MNFKNLCFLVLIFLVSISSKSQSFNDGPIEIQTKLREVNTVFDGTDVGQSSTIASLATPDELSFILWAKDNLGVFPWTGGICDTADFNPSYNGGTGTNSRDFDNTFATMSFPTATVPQFLDFKLDAWEDDNNSDPFVVGIFNININTTGSRFLWDDYVCQDSICLPFIGCLCTYSDGDDYRCMADPFATGIEYRQGPPCQWFSHGFINGNPSACINTSSDASEPNTDGYYKPHIETFWRYTKGTSFANSIDLGTLGTGVLSHYNSNECYTDYYPASSGNDVIYSFSVNNPTGVNISLCGANGAQFDSYMYLVKDTTVLALSENDNFCSNQSEITTALCETGTYYIVVDATSTTELGTFTLLVTEDPSSAFTANTFVSNVSCNSGSNGQINTIISGGSSPYSYNWYDSNMLLISSNLSTVNLSDSLVNLGSANYILQISDNNNCTLTDTFLVTQPTALSMTTSSLSASCNSYSDGQVDVLVTGGTASYSYSWNCNPIQNNANAVFLPSGTYLLTVTDANNCIDTISETITEPVPVPVSIFSSTTAVWCGGSVNLQASGAVNYNWSPPIWLSSSVGSNVVSTPNTSVDYILNGTDNFGCFNSDTISITVIQSLQLSNTPSSPSVCEGESVNVSVNGASNFSWFPSNGLNNPNASNVSASPSSTTIYMVVGTDNFGCSDTIFVNIDVLLKPNIAVTNSPSICEGESVSLIANGANNYNWFPSNGLNSVIGNTVTSSPLLSTSYSVIGTVNNGCSDTVSTVVSVNPNPILTTVAAVVDICKGDTSTLFVNGASTYIWNPILGLNNSTVDTVQSFPVSDISYTIIGMDSLGCTSSANIFVNVNDLPIIELSAPKPEICIGEFLLLSATGGVQYSWLPQSSLSSNVGSVVSANPTVNTTYMVVGTDANSCSSWDTISVLVNPLPILSLNNISSTICEGENVPLIVSGANTYLWSPSLGLNNSVGNSVIASPISTTNFLITATDFNGCIEVIYSTVLVNPSPNLSLNPATAAICTGSSLQIEGFGANSYVWSPSYGLNTTTSNIVLASPNSDVIYNVVGTDLNNCKDSIDFQLIVGVPPTVSISPVSAVICEGESVTLSVDGATNYVWYPDATLSSNIGVSVVSTPLITTNYEVIGTDLIGCEDTSNIVVSVIPLPTASIVSGGGVVCSGDSASIVVNLTGNPNWNITYSVNGSVSSVSSSTSPVIIYSNLEGTYTIPFISDANGCTNVGTGSELVDVINTPQANVDFSPENPNMLNPEVSFINNSIFSNSYLWLFGDNSPNSTEFEPTHVYELDDTYQVLLLAENGPCTDTAFVVVTVDPYYALYVPNTFTPNDDGRNDDFEPKGVGIKEFEIYIFNRWGEEVFHSIDIDVCWDGGKAVPSSYSYVISVVDKMGEFHRKTGNILIE